MGLIQKYLRRFGVNLILPDDIKHKRLQGAVIEVVTKLLVERDKAQSISFNEALHRVESLCNSAQFQNLVPQEWAAEGGRALSRSSVTQVGEICTLYKSILENALWTILPFPEERRAALSGGHLEAACLSRLVFASCRKFPSLSPADVVHLIETLCQQTESKFPLELGKELLELGDIFMKIYAVCDGGGQFWSGLEPEEFMRKLATWQRSADELKRGAKAVYSRVFVDKTGSLTEEFSKIAPLIEAQTRGPSVWELGLSYRRVLTIEKARGNGKKVEELERTWGEAEAEFLIFMEYLHSEFYRATSLIPKKWTKVKSECVMNKADVVEMVKQRVVQRGQVHEALMAVDRETVKALAREELKKFVVLIEGVNSDTEDVQCGIFRHKLHREKSVLAEFEKFDNLGRAIDALLEGEYKSEA